jgi:hypothetical protein
MEVISYSFPRGMNDFRADRLVEARSVINVAANTETN